MSLTTSLQVCMDSSLEWLQESEGGIMGSSSSSSEMENILTCSRPVLERRMRPQHEQALECPRCHSTHTKFCYYNNYSLSQPRYFCKSCRRYWTNGGTLRNIPVGGGCRKNKKSSSPSPNKKLLSSNDHHLLSPFGSSSSTSANPTDFQLMSFPEVMPHHHQFPSSANFIGIENPTPIDFMDTKYGSLVDNNNNQDFLGNNNADEIMGMMNNNTTSGGLRFGAAGVCSSSYGVMCVDGNSSSSSSTTAMLPYPHLQNNNNAIDDVKPNADALSLEWQDQGSAPPKNSFAYINEMGSWTTGFMR